MGNKEELPLLSEVIEAYDKGDIKEFEGVIACRPFKDYRKEHGGKGFWIPYTEIVAMSELNKVMKKDFDDMMWGNYKPKL